LRLIKVALRTPNSLDLIGKYSAANWGTKLSKVLVDLSAASEGYTGIGHDSRMIFSMLSRNEELAVSGLIYGNGRPIVHRLRAGAKNIPARIAANIHGTAIGWDRPVPGNLVEKWMMIAGEAHGALRANHRIEKVADWMKTDAIWRILFQRSLPPGDREQVLQRDYYVTDTTYLQMGDRHDYWPWLAAKKIHAEGFDAVLFPHPRPVRLPAGIKRLVRYHDAVPLTHPDTVVHWSNIIQHYDYTKLCTADGVFICNSPMSLDDLDNLAPGTGERSIVIPCTVQARTSSGQKSSVREILLRKLTLMTIGGAGAAFEDSARKKIAQGLMGSRDFRYIISVATLEPRKNFVNAIGAWERMRQRTGFDIKFVIVGSGGWHQDISHKAMRPHVTEGNIIHVEDVTLAELQSLYQGAQLCLFPSFAEGFGYAPLEALQMGTPSVVSNLPVFRWMLGGAALYADPYDVSDISDAMEQLLDTPENKSRRYAMNQLKEKILERFSLDAVSRQWQSFFAEDMERLFRKPAPSP
jgi:glycosyltransferase involved in cell wall biosynthesis